MSNSVSENTASPGSGASERQKLGDQAQSREALRQITERNATSSPLFRLPAEIRNMVFNHVFQDERYCIGPGYWMEDYPSLRRNLSLLLVSRQLYHETVLLPYKLAVFQLLYHSYEHSVLLHLKGFLRGQSKAQIEVMV
ncbi:hypothetical protein AA0112_g10711 [Alternaria arborescens]|nr:hypothetical protein AA0112_g10711 [Alternaria arborescens]